MSKKGFTLIELLAVIALLGVIITIAVPGVGAVKNAIQKNMLEKKIEMIEHAAVLYAQDYDMKSGKIKVFKLVEEGYLDKDNDNACQTESTDTDVGCIVDPTNKDNFLDLKIIIIEEKNYRIYATYKDESTSESTDESTGESTDESTDESTGVVS